MQPEGIRAMTVLRLTFAALLIALAPALGAAQEAPAAPPWSVSCNSNASGDLVCSMSQTISAAPSGQRIMTAVVFRDPETSALKMRVGMPHGLYLPAGVGVAVDQGDAQIYPILTADQNGSYTTFDLDEAMVTAMRRGNTLVFTMENMARNQVRIEMSLQGFTKALNNLF